MSRAYPEAGELWTTRRPVSPESPRRRTVRILSVDDQIRFNERRGIEIGRVHYEYTGGMNARLRNSHKLDTFVQKYERTKEAEK